MAFRKNVKKYARKAWKVVKKVTGDRYGRGWKQISTKGIPQMVKDINYLKQAINSEKLRFVIASSATSPIGVGQIKANAPGYFTTDITPTPSQGDGYNNRTGSSIKLHSTNMRFCFTEQNATATTLRFKIFIFKPKMDTLPATAVSEIFNANPFTGFIDYNSTRNPDYFKDYQLVRFKRVTIPMNPASLTGQVGVREARVGLKYKSHHVRWDKNTSIITGGQLIMVVFCDTGNDGAVTPTVAPYNSQTVPMQNASSGAFMMYNIEHFYYDN